MKEDFRIKSSVLADLGPLPDVVESNTETVWDMFLQLDAQQPAADRGCLTELRDFLRARSRDNSTSTGD
jgi:hypothetical protein